MAIYLDHNATTPLDQRVLEVMLPWLNGSGNPSSLHSSGRAARQAIETAREQVADLVRVHPSQVTFTSGGTESNNTALHGALAHLPLGGLAVSSVEHPSVLEPARALERQGWRLDTVPVDRNGMISQAGLESALGADTRLVSLMWANNETGVIQDLPSLAHTARAAGCIVHTDAVQAAGKVDLDFSTCGAHLMSLSAHKMYGPLGAGALIRDLHLELRPLLLGGGQEKGLRSGTENIPAIVGFGRAAELAALELAARQDHLLRLRERLQTGLHTLEGVDILAASATRLANTCLIAVAGIDGETLLMNLDRAGIAVSSGSACGSGKREPSHVLRAMGIPDEQGRGAIRISLGYANTETDVDTLLAVLGDQVRLVQAMAGRVAMA